MNSRTVLRRYHLCSVSYRGTEVSGALVSECHEDFTMHERSFWVTSPTLKGG